jgi:putative peptide zinc metalloprotease protein
MARHPRTQPDRPASRLDLAIPGRPPLAVRADMTIGRAPENSIRFVDPSVSRRHARILHRNGRLLIADLNSSSGTWVDGVRITQPTELADGSQIRLGDQMLVVERRRGANESSATMIVSDIPSGTPPARPAGVGAEDHPMLRPGYALKRLAASEGDRRYVLKDLRSGGFVRLTSEDRRLIELLDGTRSAGDLVLDAERLLGDGGGARVARLLAELADRGLLEGVDGRETARSPGGVLRPREWVWTGTGERFERVYTAGGRWLVSPLGLLIAAILIVVGLALFPYLVFARYGTPFVVVKHIGLGGAVFLAGRLGLGVVHETAHAMALASFGRRVGRGGLKLVLIFPYFFVDTSDAWFERRRRRIAVSAAGPATDLALAGLFSLGSLALAPGAVRDVLFQLAFAAYLGGLFNLNPFLERDGYHVLVDVLGEPRLRQRAQKELREVLAGRAPLQFGLLMRYAIGGLAWSTVASLFAVVMSLRYESTLATLLPTPVVWLVLAVCWVAFFTPMLLIVVPALSRGSRHVR